MTLHSLSRSELTEIARTIRDARYDVSFDLRTSTEDLIGYIEHFCDYFVLTETNISMVIKLPSTTSRVIFFNEAKQL